MLYTYDLVTVQHSEDWEPQCMFPDHLAVHHLAKSDCRNDIIYIC